jgi:hypothetical protein
MEKERLQCPLPARSDGQNRKPRHTRSQRGTARAQCLRSVGAQAVDLTLTSQSGDKEYFRRNLSLAELGRMLLGMLAEAAHRKRNVIVRQSSSWNGSPRRARGNHVSALYGFMKQKVGGRRPRAKN